MSDSDSAPLPLEKVEAKRSAQAFPSVMAEIKARPVTSNWTVNSVLQIFSWFFATLICAFNFYFATVLIAQGEPVAAAFSIGYGLISLWLFGSAIIGIPLVNLAINRLEKRDFAAAEKIFDHYIKTVERLHMHRDDNFTTSQANLALIKLARGDYHDAEVLYESLIQRRGAKQIAVPTQVNALYLNNLACVKLAQACAHAEVFDLEIDEAERLANEALSIWRGLRSVVVDQGGTAYPLLVLGEIDLLRGKLNSAEGKILEAIRLNDAGVQSPFVLPAARQALYFESNFWLALLFLKQIRKEDADVLCCRLLSELALAPAPVFQHSLTILHLLAEQYLALEDFVMAEAVVNQAYPIARLHPVHPDARKVADHFEAILLNTDRAAEVDEMKLWIRPLPGDEGED